MIVEVCASLKAVKYIHRVLIALQSSSMPASTRFESTCRAGIGAMWGVRGFPVFSHFPSALLLVVHLPSRLTVKWREISDRALEKIEAQRSFLAFFKYSRENPFKNLLILWLHGT